MLYYGNVKVKHMIFNMIVNKRTHKEHYKNKLKGLSPVQYRAQSLLILDSIFRLYKVVG